MSNVPNTPVVSEVSGKQTTLINFVARGSSPDEWKMVLVEQGPWNPPIEDNLRRLQERLYGCVDGAIDGKVAEQFPQTLGKKILIQVDCYNLPEKEVEEFFRKFAAGVFELPDYRDALRKSPFVSEVTFEIVFDRFH